MSRSALHDFPMVHYVILSKYYSLNRILVLERHVSKRKGTYDCRAQPAKTSADDDDFHVCE